MLKSKIYPLRAHLAGTEFYLKPHEREQYRRELLEEYLPRNGNLKRYEMWYADYYIQSYLKHANKAEYIQRWHDIWDNQMQITQDNKIGLGDISKNDKWVKRFSEYLAEGQFRGGVPALPDADLIMKKFSAKSDFTITHPPESVISFDFIFKFGQREHLEQIISSNCLRLTNSAQYNDNSLNNAQRDDEQAFSFLLSSELLRKVDGLTGLTELDPNIPTNLFEIKHASRENYLMWCGALGYDRRMPYAFDANAVLVIKNPKLFRKKVSKAIKSKGMAAQIAKVRYFDPFLDIEKTLDLRFSKHFRFEYQREYRVVARGQDLPDILNLEVPKLAEICEIYNL